MLIRLLLALLLAHGTQASELKVGLGSYDYPPFYYQQGDQLTGAAIDIAQQLAQQLGHQLHFQRMPFARVQRLLASGELDMVVLFFRTTEREQYALYLDEPHLIEASYLLVNPEMGPFPERFSGDFNDWRQYAFLSVRGYFHGAAFADADFLNKLEVNSEQELLQRLTSQRPLVGLGNKATLQYHARQLGLLQKLQFIEPAVDVGKDYIAFSRRHHNAQALADSFSQALRAFKTTPQYQQILQRYGVRGGVGR